jgi:hypothetical protein
VIRVQISIMVILLSFKMMTKKISILMNGLRKHIKLARRIQNGALAFHALGS